MRYIIENDAFNEFASKVSNIQNEMRRRKFIFRSVSTRNHRLHLSNFNQRYDVFIQSYREIIYPFQSLSKAFDHRTTSLNFNNPFVVHEIPPLSKLSDVDRTVTSSIEASFNETLLLLSSITVTRLIIELC